jgi:L-xylulokinase
MGSYLLGIDNGLTVTKAVVFDTEGRQLGSGEVRTDLSHPYPRWVERDMAKHWEDCCQAIRLALVTAGITGQDIAAVGPTAYGDGIYLVDKDGRPVRPAIVSLDSRAYQIAEQWRASGIADQALPLTGQQPMASAPATVLAWLKEFEPESFKLARWLFFGKDWIKFKLTGQITTDPTEASTGFTDVNTQQYSPAAFQLYGLEECQEKMAPVAGCMQVIGRVTKEAAESTGLTTGTPVVSGIHDVDASAIGSGCVSPGQLTLIAGTWSINEVISDRPVEGPHWFCRNFVVPRQWMNMSVSPASATNLEWFVKELCPLEIQRAAELGVSPFAFVNEEVQAVLEGDSHVFFHPFLYGSPHGDKASAAFFGLHGWHKRGHILRALFEGVVFNHKTHVDPFLAAFQISEARLTGGGARSILWSQLFADALAVPVHIVDVTETGALGAALCAGVGAGIYSSLEQAAQQTVHVIRSHQPNPENHARLSAAYETYLELVRAMEPVWPRLG